MKDYNADYLYLLSRAATGNYNCLVTSSRILKDFHDMIMTVHSVSELDFEIPIYPFTFRGSTEYFNHLGFDDEQTMNILGFIVFVQTTYGQEFEECMEETRPLLCTK